MGRLKPLPLEPIGEPPGLLSSFRGQAELTASLPPALGVSRRLGVSYQYEPHGAPAPQRDLAAILMPLDKGLSTSSGV